MNFETILVSIDEASRLGIVTLNRPDKRNALNAQMISEITRAVDFLAKDEIVRVIRFNGNTKAFCAGADLAEIQAMQGNDFEANLHDSRALRDMFYRIFTCPKPTVAVVNGPALAGGAGLATCCDFVMASTEAKFGYPEVKIGFVAALVMVMLTRQVGERAARDLLLSGAAIPAQEALAIGLINRVCSPDLLEEEAEALCKELSNNSPQAMMLTKELLSDVWDGPIEANLDAAARRNARSRSTEDCKEGIAAFLEKRKPVWSGKTHDIKHEA